MAEPKPDSKSKQIRFRVTEAERDHLDAASSDAGFKELSAFLRAVSLDQHIVALGPELGVVVIPAWSSTPAERLEAEGMVAALLEAATAMAVAVAGPQPAQPAPAPEVLPEPMAAPPVSPVGLEAEQNGAGAPPLPQPVSEGAGAAPPAAAPVTAPAVPAPAPDFIPPAPETLPPIPEEVLNPPQALGPQPQVSENMAAFVARRGAELRLQGRTPVAASYEAEAEWRAALDAANQPPAPPPQQPGQPRQPMPGERPRPDLVGEGGRGFCPNCGAENAGTAFCAGCGAQL